MKLLNLRYNPIVHSTPSYSLTITTSWNRLHQGTQMGLNINDSRCRYGCGCLWNRMEPETFFKCTVFITFTLDDEILVLASSDKKALEWFIHSCPNPNSSLLATMDEFVNESKNKRKHKSPSAGEGHDNLMCWCIIMMLYGRSVLCGRWSMYGTTRYPAFIHEFDHFLHVEVQVEPKLLRNTSRRLDRWMKLEIRNTEGWMND